jgi:aspartate racemase
MGKPSIGILAGMGPRSTAPFIDMVIDECQLQYGAKDDMDFPKMIIYSLPTPFHAGRPIDHEDMKNTILAGLMELARTGVDFIAMPCNTAHIYYEELKRAIDIPLLNIVDETVAAIGTGCTGVALFATRATMDSGIYQKALAAGGKTLVAQPDWQGRIDGLIRSIKADRQDHGNAEAMASLMSEAARLGADTVVIGCTDLTPAARGCSCTLEIVDSAQCLARAAVTKYVRLLKEMPNAESAG